MYNRTIIIVIVIIIAQVMVQGLQTPAGIRSNGEGREVERDRPSSVLLQLLLLP